MAKQWLKIGSLLFIVLILGLLTWKIVFGSNEIVYIKLNEVYEKFDLRPELEAKYKSVETTRKNLLDSMEFQVSRIQASGDKIMYEEALNQYINKRKELETANTTLSEQFEKQIWNQINTYCQEFGKRNHYSFILGAQGSGAIMYASEGKDISNEIIAFINNEYHGKTKK